MTSFSKRFLRAGPLQFNSLSILKYIFKEDLKDRLAGIFELLKDLSEKQTGLEYIEAILRYIANAAPDGNISYEDLKTAIEQTIPDKGG